MIMMGRWGEEIERVFYFRREENLAEDLQVYVLERSASRI